MGLNSTVIPQEETLEWLKDDNQVITHITQAYKECIKSALNPLIIDPRFLINNHVANPDFIKNPMFLFGFHQHSHTVLSVLYVYPAFRRQGLATYLIQAIQNQVRGTIQVAIDSRQPNLGKLYSRNGFRTLGHTVQDDIGDGYIDYFWSSRPFRLEQRTNGTDVIFI